MREGKTDQNILHKKNSFQFKKKYFQVIIISAVAGPCYVVQDSFELCIILSLPPKCWDDGWWSE